MKQDTLKRIKAYQNALPHMKERVMAVALLLVISISMMTSATFAWITLSKSPEVVGLATTIATNGNLEIALSDTDGLAPDDTMVGDGGKDVLLTNLTWGNLVNLSDPRYGLESITLRPAVLDTGTLNTAPLYSVEYGADGRIIGTVSDFMFTNYGTKDGVSAFYVPDDGTTDYGVRAISSVSYSTQGEEQLVDQMNTAMKRSYLSARSAFQSLYGNKTYMNSVTQLAGVYLNYRLNDSDQSCGIYIEDIYYMTEDFHKTMELVKQNILDIANLRHYIYCNQNDKAYTAFTEADLLNGTMKTKLAAENIIIAALDTYISMRTKFYGDGVNGAYFKIKKIYTEYKRTGRFVGWEELAGVGSTGGPINALAEIPSATVNGVKASAISSDNIDEIIGHDPNICVVQKGLIKDMDQLLGTQLHAKVDSISVSMKGIPVSVKNVEVSTAAQSPWILSQDNTAASEAAASDLVAKNATAADTYGMAIDFWIRTNSKNSKLILEGEYVKETVILTDAAGNPLLDDNDNPIKEEKIVGYQGVNRVWEDNDQSLPNHMGLGTSATQGAGSCYIFYLDNPEDQQQSLEMLKAMTVAFVDQNGNLLVTAALDTDNVFEDGGRILVPLQARGRTVITGQTPKLDDEGNPVIENGEVVMENVEEVIHYITDLNANEPTRITAIMYMDGAKLTNSQVLAAGSIKGQLNIQFGTTEDLVSVNDKDLKDDYYNITLNVTEVSGNFDAYDPNDKPVVDVTVTLEGMDAKVVKGNFTSMLSTSQGAKQDPFVLTRRENSATWTARVTLNGAGTYQLRSIQIDGVDYAFDAEMISQEQVVIPGTTVNNVTCAGWTSNKFNYMSADAFYKLQMTVDISGTRPRSVQAVFENANRQNVLVTFGSDGENRWSGTGVFTTSGTYDLTYMVIDGVRVPLLGTDYKHLELKLGMKTRVFMTQPVNAEYKALEEIKKALDETTVTLTAQQKTLAAQTIAESNLTEAEKTALTSGVNGTLTSTQKTTLKAVLTAEMEAVLDELYNGDPNDDEDGLQMVSTASGYTFFFLGGAGNELYMDVSCIITDDKGNMLTGLSDVELQYQLGASATFMDSDMVWNSATGYYEGQFQLYNPGNYTFKQLLVGENHITSASSAPRIAANSRDPMEYAGPGVENVAVYRDINPNASRDMTVVLKYAPSATVKMILQYSDTDASGNALLETHELLADLSYSDNDNNLYEYTVSVPKDGNWKIVGMQVANVVYADATGQKVYYDGGDTAEGGTGWVDLTQEVLADNIATKFFTTVIYSVNTQPNIDQGYSGEFMTDHKVENMKVTLTDYLGRPVEGADVTLKYEWNSGSAANYFTVNQNTTYPNSKFEATKQSDGITFAMPATMNFQLPGQYNITFSMKIGEEAYNFSDFTKAKNSVELKTNKSLEVSWSLPDVKITAVTNATKDSLNNRTFYVDLNSDGSGVAYAPLAVQNYFEDYYAVAYMNTPEKGTHTAPDVTLQMAGIGNATSAKIALSATDWSCQYTFTPTGTAELPKSTQTFGGVSTSLLDFVKDRYRAGTQKITAVTMTYGGIDYAVKTAKTVELYQPQAPSYYLILNYDGAVMGNIGDVIGISSKGKQFTASGTAGSVTISSPDNRTFKVVLPKATTIVPDRIYDDPNMSITYDAVDGTAKSSYVYYKYTKDETSGCSTVTNTYYKQYQRYERVATKIGTREHYEDTYIIYKWGSYDSDTEFSVTKAVTLTGATPTQTSKLLKTEQLKDNITEYIYKAVSGKDKLSAKENSADPEYYTEEEIVQTWTEIK